MISRRRFLGASGAALAGLAGAGIPSARANSVAVPRGPLNAFKVTDVKTAAIDIGYTAYAATTLARRRPVRCFCPLETMFED